MQSVHLAADLLYEVLEDGCDGVQEQVQDLLGISFITFSCRGKAACPVGSSRRRAHVGDEAVEDVEEGQGKGGVEGQ